ncbi:Helicase C-terminal [Arabidopsis suecica]|uniref:ATP-dependent RNA helicase n=1 Tax=Arabidopsis suecica TaxID=45249 RepID=A0A8T2B8K0_ARASU|nr:Helicase C-terminal [Arabidopsis suecica]
MKVIIFCTTVMVTRLVADLLGKLSLNVREIHSRKPQSYRTRVSDEFRKSKSIILVTSDVSARGVDYPDVSLVVHMGLPLDKEQYIHRLGRTRRKGKEGEGVLLLAPWEEYFLSSVKDLPITKSSLPPIDHEAVKKVSYLSCLCVDDEGEEVSKIGGPKSVENGTKSVENSQVLNTRVG